MVQLISGDVIEIQRVSFLCLMVTMHLLCLLLSYYTNKLVGFPMEEYVSAKVTTPYVFVGCNGLLTVVGGFFGSGLS